MKSDRLIEAGAYRRLVDGLLPVLAEVGADEIAAQSAGSKVTAKTDGSPVTEADGAAEAKLMAALAHLLPGVPIVAEEDFAAGREPEGGTGAPGDAVVLLDPLDGTRDFIAGRDSFSINVGIVQGGRPAFGLIFAPARARVFATLEPGGAYEAALRPGRTGGADQGPDLSWRRLAVRVPPPEGMTALLSRSTGLTPMGRAFLEQHGIAPGRQQSVGSALKFGMIAAGEADVYPRFGPTCEWDTAAGEAILTAAGGSVRDLDGQPLVYGKVLKKYVNPKFVAWGRRW